MNNIKQQLETYITDNYNKLLKAAKFITKDDTAGDLLNDVLIYLLTRETYSDKINNCTNFYNYIVRAMAIQHFSNHSEYAKKYIKNLPLFDFEEEHEEYNITYEEIINWVRTSDIFKNRIKSFACKTIFLDYYDNEHNYNLSGMTTEEVKQIQKTNMRNIANKYDISYFSVRRAIHMVLDKVKEKYR